MNEQILQRHFRNMGAELKMKVIPEEDWRYRTVDYVLDVEKTRKGEHFSLQKMNDHLEACLTEW